MSCQNGCLTCIPYELSLLPHVMNINFRKNYIMVVPDHIWNLERLKQLWLDNNYITQIQFAQKRLDSLQTLCLCNNQIILFPDSIIGLRNLNELFLKGNKGLILSERTTLPHNLEYLDLSETDIEKPPASFYEHPKLSVSLDSGLFRSW